MTDTPKARIEAARDELAAFSRDHDVRLHWPRVRPAGGSLRRLTLAVTLDRELSAAERAAFLAAVERLVRACGGTPVGRAEFRRD